MSVRQPHVTTCLATAVPELSRRPGSEPQARRGASHRRAFSTAVARLLKCGNDKISIFYIGLIPFNTFYTSAQYRVY